MRDLTPVRLTAGGSTLVLVDEQGVEHAVPVLALQETLGHQGTTAAPADPQRKEQAVESTLRPRDIQARIRAGESPEDVAGVAGTSVEKVMIFATPVLAERAHVAQSALAASVRRTTPDAHSPAVATARALGAAVGTRLREVGVDPETVVWDSWRREDGRWTLQAGYRHHDEDRRARFSYDQRGHFVHADDDDARWLVADGQVPARAARPAPAAQDPAPGLRLAPPYVDHELPVLGDDALDLVAGDIADTDWVASEGDTPRGAPAASAAASGTAIPTQPTDRTDKTRRPAAPEQRAAPRAPEHEDTTEIARDATVEESPAPRRATAKKRGRASVPSWDEIMFGGGS